MPSPYVHPRKSHEPIRSVSFGIGAATQNNAERLMKITLRDEAAEALEQIAVITEKPLVDAVSDAIRSYLYVLRVQADGGTIVVEQPNGPEEEFENLIKNMRCDYAFIIV